VTSSTRPIRLIIVFGGQSAEHDVSCNTAAHVLAAVNRDHYQVEAVGITRTGVFVTAAEAKAALAAGADLPDALVAEGPSTDLVALASGNGIEPVSMEPADTVVLPLLHGPLGEDGTIQGMLELADVAYVGAGVLGSAVTMDKAMTKTVLDAHGIPQARWLAFKQAEIERDRAGVIERIIDTLGPSVFVKPANMGSSIGVSKADSAEAVSAALDLALHYDELVVVEEAVVAREIELSLLGNDEVEVSVPGEIIPGAEFYDYEDKYLDGAAQLIIPAELSDEAVTQMSNMAIDAYRSLRVEGMARADFLYEEGGRGPLLNELNTIPGFTPISMYPKLWEASGLPYAELIDRLVELALERHTRRDTKRVTDHP
jgi:D-alanine-D-alanine ligase